MVFTWVRSFDTRFTSLASRDERGKFLSLLPHQLLQLLLDLLANNSVSKTLGTAARETCSEGARQQLQEAQVTGNRWSRGGPRRETMSLRLWLFTLVSLPGVPFFDPGLRVDLLFARLSGVESGPDLATQTVSPTVLPKTGTFLCTSAAILPKTDAFPCTSAAILPKTDAFACGAAADRGSCNLPYSYHTNAATVTVFQNGHDIKDSEANGQR